MKTHRLKCYPEPFAAMWMGKKVHEFRRNDRGFVVGDVLELVEWEPKYEVMTGSELRRLVTYVSYGPDWGIPEGYVVMSVQPL